MATTMRGFAGHMCLYSKQNYELHYRIIKSLTKNALSRRAGRPTVHPRVCTPRVWNRAGRRAGSQDSSVALLPQQKTPDSPVTPLQGILHLTLCSVTRHACRPRLWTPSRVESSRVESSWAEPARYSSSQELNYGLLVAPILYSQMCARALAPWQILCVLCVWTPATPVPIHHVVGGQIPGGIH
jgi:hypothetical protein